MSQLNVLGPVQVNEPPSLTQQRSALTRQKNTLLNEQRQASSLSRSASDMAAQIFSLRRSLFDSQISTRWASPISVVFWSNIIRPTDDDLSRCTRLYADVRSVTDTAVAPGNRWFFVSMLFSALLVWVTGRRVLEHTLVRLTVRWIPEGRLRRSALALAVGLATVLTISLAATLLRWACYATPCPAPTCSRCSINCRPWWCSAPSLSASVAPC